MGLKINLTSIEADLVPIVDGALSAVPAAAWLAPVLTPVLNSVLAEVFKLINAKLDEATGGAPAPAPAAA